MIFCTKGPSGRGLRIDGGYWLLLLCERSPDYYHSALFHRGYNVQLTMSFRYLGVGLFFHREALASVIEADVSSYGIVSLDLKAVRAVTDLGHAVISLGYYVSSSRESITLPLSGDPGSSVPGGSAHSSFG